MHRLALQQGLHVRPVHCRDSAARCYDRLTGVTQLGKGLNALCGERRTGAGLADHRMYVLKIVLDRLRKGQRQNSHSPISAADEADGKLRYGACSHAKPCTPRRNDIMPSGGDT